MLPVTIQLPIELTNGNDGRGSRWFRSSAVRKKIEALIRSMGLVAQPFSHAVEVRVTRVLGKGQRLWDTSSIGRGNWKEIEDAMVACGWFHDDSPKYIAETRFFQRVDRDRGPFTEVEIRDVVAATANKTKPLFAETGA